MLTLLRSVSGIRGIIGKGLDPINIIQYTNSLVTLLKAKKIVVGRDTRNTSQPISKLINHSLVALGIEVYDLDIATTPTVEVMVPHLKADGGVIITASHNPIQWNALKFLDHRGIFLTHKKMTSLFQLIDSGNFKWKGYNQYGSIKPISNGDDIHIKKIKSLSIIKPNKIKQKKIRVSYDAVNGAGYKIIPQLLKEFGCVIHPIHITPDGSFPRNPEPTNKSLSLLQNKVTQTKSHLGIATDPDADRCALVDENGKAIGEEYTLALCADLVLEKQKSPFCVNFSTSDINKEIAEKHNCSFYKTPVGEINVIERMIKTKSLMGGEGNGGVIYSPLHYGRDSLIAVALILQGLSEKNCTLSEWVSTITPQTMIKSKIALSHQRSKNSLKKILNKEPKVKKANLQLGDGYLLNWTEGWTHIRQSNTEPVIRIISEGKNAKETKARHNHFVNILKTQL